jgi:hypothetical protein
MQIQEAEAIDYLKTKCMLRADKHCRKLKKGEVEFSSATIGPIKSIIVEHSNSKTHGREDTTYTVGMTQKGSRTRTPQSLRNYLNPHASVPQTSN